MFVNSNTRRFQKGLDHAAARADRHNNTLSLRRKQREQHLQKKVRLLSSRLTDRSDRDRLNDGNITTENNNTKVYKKDIPKYIALIMQTESETKQLSGLISIRKLLSVERDPPTQEIIKSGIIPKIIQFMYCSNYNLVFESAWSITNIAASTSDCTYAVVNHGAINAFINVILNNNFNFGIEIIIQSIWGLGNICGDKKQFRDMIINNQSEICNKIINLMLKFDITDSKYYELYNNGTWLINNILRPEMKYLKLINFQNKFSNLLQLIYKILSESSSDLLISNSLWCLNYLSMSNDLLIEYIVNFKENALINLCMKLLSLEIGKYEIALSKNNDIKQAILTLNCKIYRPCLRFIGNILTGNDNITQCVLNCGYLDCIEPFLNHFLPRFRREIMWSLSNIFAGNQQQIEHILSRKKLMATIINCALNDTKAVRFEAIICITNAVVEAIPTQKKRLVEYGSINALCQLLNPNNRLNDREISIIIEGLEEFLKTFDNLNLKYTNPFALQIEECKGLDYLEQRSTDIQLAQTTWNSIVNLMKKYWENENENIKPNDINNQSCINTTVNTKTNQFNFGSATSNNNNNNNNIRFDF